jgi:two-component system, OmpR family, response regulator
VFDIDRRSLKKPSGEEQDLTTSEFNILEVFVKRPQRVLSHHDLIDLLKGHDWSLLHRAIDNLVTRLRKKIQQDADRPASSKPFAAWGI